MHMALTVCKIKCHPAQHPQSRWFNGQASIIDFSVGMEVIKGTVIMVFTMSRHPEQTKPFSGITHIEHDIYGKHYWIAICAAWDLMTVHRLQWKSP